MDSVALYIKELRNDNSNKEESLELIRQIRSGDESAREKLIKNYLLLVVKIARIYKNTGVPLADLISEGNFGLMTAIDKFDISKGAPFSTYAKVWIKQSIIRNCMHKKRLVRLPENISNLMLSGRWEGEPHREVSIDAPNTEGDTMADDIPEIDTPNIFSREEDMLVKAQVEKLLSHTKKRDADIVKACYGIGHEKPMDVAEVAELYNLTTTRINQILRNTLKKARSKQTANTFKVFKISSAKYGADGNYVDLTIKISQMHLQKEEIRVGNKLGGDPCKGMKKSLIVEFLCGDKVITKSFPEGTFAKI